MAQTLGAGHFNRLIRRDHGGVRQTGQEFSINSVRAALASLHKAGAIGKTGSKWHPVAGGGPGRKKRGGKAAAKKA